MVVRTSDDQSLETLAADITVTEALRDIVGTLVREHLPTAFFVNPSRAPREAMLAHETLRQAGIELVITLGRRSQPLGRLGAAQERRCLFQPDLPAESLAELASIALDNALLYRQRVQMLEYSDRLLREALRFGGASGRCRRPDHQLQFRRQDTAQSLRSSSTRSSRCTSIPSGLGPRACNFGCLASR